MAQLYSTLPYHGPTSFYFTLPWLYFILLDSTVLYITLSGSTSLYFTLHYPIMALLYSSFLYPCMALYHSTLFYIIPPWVYFTLLDCTLLYHGSTSLYFTLRYRTLAQYSSLYFTLLNFTLLHPGSTSLYLILHYSTVALFHCTIRFHGCT